MNAHVACHKAPRGSSTKRGLGRGSTYAHISEMRAARARQRQEPDMLKETNIHVWEAQGLRVRGGRRV